MEKSSFQEIKENNTICYQKKKERRRRKMKWKTQRKKKNLTKSKKWETSYLLLITKLNFM